MTATQHDNKTWADERKKPIIVAFIVVSALILMGAGSMIGIEALDHYLKNNNYVLCDINDLKRSNDILNGDIYTTNDRYIITQVKKNDSYVSPWAKDWEMSKWEK
jgi:hypothetical protein